MEPPRPKLEGAVSLRDALKQVSLAKKDEDTSPASGAQEKERPIHAPDLKETLGAVAPTAPTRPPPRPAPAPATPEPPKAVAQEKQESPERKPAGLPEDVMRTMLAVDGFDAGKSS